MNTIQIKKCMSIISGDLKDNVYASNELPIFMSKPIYLISNLDPNTKPGSHWIAISIDVNGFGEYFDSYGRKPAGHHLTFLKNNAKRWVYNPFTIQNNFTSVCGQYCLVFLYLKFKGISMHDFLNYFCNNTLFNDLMLHDMFNYLGLGNIN